MPLTTDAEDDRSYQLELGTGSLISLFCFVAIVCGLFFSFGYTLGKHSVPATLDARHDSTAASLAIGKPNPSTPLSGGDNDAAQPPNATDLTAAEANQVPPTLQSTSNTDASHSPAKTDGSSAHDSSATDAKLAPVADTTIPPGQYTVQVFAGNKEDDALSLAAALKARQYPAFVRRPGSGAPDQLFRVQIGPYATEHDATEIQGRLAADGYGAVVKKY